MKNIYLYFVLLFILLSSCSSTRTYQGSNEGYNQNDEQAYNNDASQITYQQFYDGLSPYGNWVDYGNYGYAWTPNDPNFRPYYSDGHWVYTTYGWTWASDYNWGWAPFHYGRWTYDNAYGWMWLPGYQWAPAWVSWRSGGDYYGWAPLGPGMNAGGNYYGSDVPNNYWAFVPNRYINSPRINNYYINTQQNTTIINNTTVINNTYINNNKTVYVSGPSATDVERHTNKKIGPVQIVQANTPGRSEVNGSTFRIYKPVIKDAAQQQQNTQTYRPARITNLNDQKSFHQQHAAERDMPANNSAPEKSNNNKNNFPGFHNNPTVDQTQQQPVSPQPPVKQPVRTFTPKNNQVNNNDASDATTNKTNEDVNRDRQTSSQQQNNYVPPQKPQPNFSSPQRNNPMTNRPVAPEQNNNQQAPVRIIQQKPNNNNNVSPQSRANQQQNAIPQNNRINQPQPGNPQQPVRQFNNRSNPQQPRFNQPNATMRNNPVRPPVIINRNNSVPPPPQQTDDRKKQ